MSKKSRTPEQLAIQRRHMARRLAVQAVYQWQLTGHSLKELLDQFAEDRDYHKADPSYFAALLAGVVNDSAALDQRVAPWLPRDIELIDDIERAVLRLAVYELANHVETPYRVVINEAINLTKLFGAVGSHKFINGVLEKVWRELRPLEARVNAPDKS